MCERSTVVEVVAAQLVLLYCSPGLYKIIIAAKIATLLLGAFTSQYYTRTCVHTHSAYKIITCGVHSCNIVALEQRDARSRLIQSAFIIIGNETKCAQYIVCDVSRPYNTAISIDSLEKLKSTNQCAKSSVCQLH